MIFQGFTPDAPSDAEGVMLDVVNIVPTQRGMAAAPTGIAPPGIGALPSPVIGSAGLVSSDGIRRTYVGTGTRLYELTGTTWTDRSRAGVYTSGSESKWIFTQFGVAALATNDQAPIQASISGAFADIPGAPAAKIIVSASNFVLAFNTSDATFGDQPDRWRSSALFDHTSWSINPALQATSGRLVGEGGEITAAARLGQNVVVYKKNAMWLGQYVGPPVVWQFDQIPGASGCVGELAVCEINGAHVFVGDDDIWLYDGTRPRSIAEGKVKQWFNQNCSPTFRYKTECSFDRQKNRVWIWFSSTESTTGSLDAALVYHLATGKWGRVRQNIQTSFIYVNPGVTYDTITGTYDTLPNVSYDSPFWAGSGVSQAVFGPANQILTLNGTAINSSFVTGDFGDDYNETFLRRARIRYLQECASANAQGFTKEGLGKSLEFGASSVQQDSKFDLRQSGRWHRLAFALVGDCEFTGAQYDLVQAGIR